METDLTSDGPAPPPAPIPGAPAAIGDVLAGRWSVAQLRGGGQGWVLVVDDVTGGARRAIKVPRTDTVAGDAELAVLFDHDPHPHVVTALGTVEVAGRRGLLLEYLPRTLAEVVGRGRDPGTGWFVPRVAVVQEICAGMAHLSQRAEVAHLDLKPSNVLVDDAGRAKVADFGLTRQVRSADGTYAAAPGGTWAYAAPEVIAGEHCDSRADVFSFGVLLYQLYTGLLPFPFRLAADPREQRAQLLAYHESDGPRRRAAELYHGTVAQRTGELPVPASGGDVGAILSGCLDPLMDRRYQTFHQLASAIEQHLGIGVVRPDSVALPDGDRLRRGVALGWALVRLGRYDEAVRRLNRLLAGPLPRSLRAEVVDAAQAALRGAGRPDDAAALDEWR